MNVRGLYSSIDMLCQNGTFRHDLNLDVVCCMYVYVYGVCMEREVSKWILQNHIGRWGK